MTTKMRQLRTPLAEVKGLGSAKSGTHHWWMQRLTAIVMIPVFVFVIRGFFTDVVFGVHATAIRWLSNPFVSVIMIMGLLAGFYHSTLGLQVIIEDYIHGEGAKLTCIILVRFVAGFLALLAIILIVKIFFFALVPMMMQNGQLKH